MTTEALFSQPAEEAVIGAILINPGVISGIDLAPEEFYIRRLGWTWQAARGLDERRAGVDLLTICDELERTGKLGEVGGAAYLTGLINATPTSMGVEDYARIVRDYARRRAWRDLANRVATTAFDLDANLEQSASGIIDGLLQAVHTPGAATHISEYTSRVFAEAIARMQNPSDLWGVETGFVDFDRATGGLQPGEVLYISGDPGIGKSILADQMGFQMAAFGKPGVIYSLEMPGEQVVRRRLAAMAAVAAREIKTGRLNDDQLSALQRAIAEVDRLPLWMSDSPDWTTSSLRADLTRMQAQHGVTWFVLDYAYLLRDRAASENDRTGLISAQLKSICRGLRLSGIVILSLNKTGLRESNKSGSEVRGSGQQFYDADLMLMLSNDSDAKNVVVAQFKKGRELERSAPDGFRLVRIQNQAAFGNFAVDQYGRPL